ncbi:MAG: phosphonate C-P lyase system protein PhnG [Opitutales bacterium]
MEYDSDYILCECDLDALKTQVERFEERLAVRVTKEPAVCLTMVRAEDSLEHQEFYLGEALTTECEVEIDGAAGYGLCLGEEPVRGYCIAVFDALLYGKDEADAEAQSFISEHTELVSQKERQEFARTLSTRVDFKLMEED